MPKCPSFRHFEQTVVVVYSFSMHKKRHTIIGVARGGAQGARAPPIEMLPMIKMSQKRLLFLQFQFF